MDLKQFQILLSRAILVPMVVAVVLSGILLAVVLSQRNASDWVDHTDTVIAESNRLLGLVVDMETGLRGYLATGNRTFLQPYQEAGNVLPARFSRLSTLVADNQQQIGRLRDIEDSVNQWRTYADGLIQHREQDRNADQNYVTLNGKQLMDGIRHQISGFIGIEEQLRLQRGARSRRISKFAIAASVALTLIFGLSLAFFSRGSMLRLSREFQTALDDTRAQAHALRTSERRWVTTLSSIGDAVIATDPNGRVTFMNSVAEHLTGFTHAEAAGRDLPQVFNIVNETTRQRHEDPVEKIKRLRTVIGLANHTVLIGKNGGETPIDDSGAPIIDGGGEMIGIVLVFRDISERKRAEAALRAADRLAATGKLAATLAHEIHNPLSNVGNLLYLLRRTELTPKAHEYLHHAEEELTRTTNISHRMLSLNRESKVPVPVRLSELLDGILESLQRRIGECRIEVKKNYDYQGTVTAFPGELRQVFLNLIMNALDAMNSSGTLELSVRPAESDNRSIAITVRDSGTGIAESARPQIFESFFTTKGEKGTGLGLWIARNIVEKHEGRISFTSHTDDSARGTEFKVVLPQPVAS